MTLFSMKSLHVDLNEAAKCADFILLTLPASLSCLCTLVQNTNGDSIWNNLTKIGSIKTWKKLTIGVQQLVRTIILSSPDLTFKMDLIMSTIEYHSVQFHCLDIKVKVAFHTRTVSIFRRPLYPLKTFP